MKKTGRMGLSRSGVQTRKTSTNQASEGAPKDNVHATYLPLLHSMEAVLDHALNLVRQEIQRLRDPNDSPERSFCVAIAKAIYDTEQSLWQITDSGRIRRDSILLQIARGATGTYAQEGRRPSEREMKEIEEATNVGVEIRCADEHVAIRMPYLPPRGLKHSSVATDMLAAALIQVYGDLPKWKSCTLTITHVYPTNISHMPKDVDNYDYKRVIDLICFALGVSDSAMTFSVHLDTLFSDELLPGTYIWAESKVPQKFGKSLWDGSHNLINFHPEPYEKNAYVPNNTPEIPKSNPEQ